MASVDRKYQCTAIRSPRGATTTEIDWADGHKGIYPHAILRGYCPCAGCQGHTGTIRFLEATGPQLDLEDLTIVGNYAVCLQWFDGHSTGLYSYKYLRVLCRCPECHPVDTAATASAGPDEHPDLPRV